MTGIRSARFALLSALVLGAGCGDSTGPSCGASILNDGITFPIFPPASSLPFADAQFRQTIWTFPPGCGRPNLGTIDLRFVPRGFPAVQFDYQVTFNGGLWFFNGNAFLNGSGLPTNWLTVSNSPVPISSGTTVLNLLSWTPWSRTGFARSPENRPADQAEPAR